MVVTRTCDRCGCRYKRRKCTTHNCDKCRREILIENRTKGNTKRLLKRIGRSNDVGNGLFPFLDELDGMKQ